MSDRSAIEWTDASWNGGMTPCADDIAVAIVAACKETGDDPIKCATGGLGTHTPNNRARHYALHALVHVFPKVDRIKLCTWVGCPGKPKYFWNSSWNQVVKPRASGLGHMANWWDDEVYDRVIRAIETARTKRSVTPQQQQKAEPSRRSEPGAVRPIETMRLAILDDDPVFDRGAFREHKPPRAAVAPKSKADLAQMLAEAARNTAALQQKDGQ